MAVEVLGDLDTILANQRLLGHYSLSSLLNPPFPRHSPSSEGETNAIIDAEDDGESDDSSSTTSIATNDAEEKQKDDLSGGVELEVIRIPVVTVDGNELVDTEDDNEELEPIFLRKGRFGHYVQV